MLTVAVFGQGNQIPTDNIKGKIQNAYQLGQVYSENNKDTLAIEYLNKGLTMALEADDLLLISEGYLQIAHHYLNANKLRESIDYLNKCLKITTQNNFKKQNANCYQLLGLNYDRLSLYKTSLSYYFQSLRINEALNNEEGIADDFNSIGNVYQHTHDFDDALSYFSKAMDINIARQDTLGILFNTHNIGVIHQKRKDFDEALKYYKEGLSMAGKIGHKGEEAILTGNIGSTYMQQGKLDMGLEYLLKALAIKKSIQSKRSILHTLNDITLVKLLMNDPEEAKRYAERVIRLAKEYEDGSQLGYAYRNLSKSYEQLSDFENAYAALENYNEVKDSLFGIEKAQQINELQIQYETEKKEQAINTLQQEKELANTRKKVYFLIGLVVLIILVGLYINQRLKNKRNQALLEKEKEVDRLKSTFFADISHEFRTPLTLILGPIETMLTSNNNPDQRVQLSMMKKNASRLLRLINQILDLSKLEYGNLVLKAEEENIIPIIKGVTSSFASLADAKDIRLSLTCNYSELRIYYNQAQVETMLINLVSNAFKFSEEGGEITVKVDKVNFGEDSAGELEISISDNGVGIASEEIAHIFDRFYQAGHADASHYGGTGIGLALTRELAELHGGSIFVESEKGRGTSVTVRLPLGKDHLDETQITEKEKSPVEIDEIRFSKINIATESDINSTEKKPIVLIIEDNEDVRQYIRMIAHTEYTIIEAVNGQEGIQQAVKYIPDLIISDVMMPGINGYDACRNLKQEEKTSHIPVILLTAKASVSSRIEGLETEADLYLSKPFVPKELLLCIRNLIQSRKKLRGRYNKQVVLKPKDIAINSVDELFLERLMKVVETNFEDENFNVDQLGREMGMSRSQIHRKLQALTNESSSQFIRSFRLQRATELLKKNNASISEIAFKVGFGSPSYFNRCFLKHYGYTPSSVVGSGMDVS